MAKVVSVINLKGGVAKTTTTIQLAECLCAKFDKRVLIVDLDPQTNATVSLIGEDRWEELDKSRQTLFHLFNDKIENTKFFDISKAIQTKVSNLRLANLSLLASSLSLIDIEGRLSEISVKTHNTVGAMEVIKHTIKPHLKNYDYVLIDCPPNLGYITQNGVEISDYYLIPAIPDILSTFGIPQIVRKIHELSTIRNLKIKCLGLVLTKYQTNSAVHKRVSAGMQSRLIKIFDEFDLDAPPVFKTLMPQANATSDAMEYGNDDKPINRFRGSFNEKYGTSKSGEHYLHQYVTITQEFLKYVGN